MAKDMSYMYPTFPIISGFLLLLCLYPVPLQWRAGNIATTSLAIWDCVGLLVSIIDVCIWHGNINNPHPVWGDIVTFYFIIAPTAIAACTLCIQYRLYTIVRAKTVFITRQQKGKQMWVTYFMCFGLPAIVGVLRVVVQDYRYNLLSDLGPMPEVAAVWLTYPLFLFWSPALCLIAAIFAVLTIRLLLQRRKSFDEMLSSGSMKLNKDHFYRLLGLALFTTFVHLPIAFWGIIDEALNVPVTSAVSWKEVHSDFGFIGYCDRDCISEGVSIPALSVQWWSLPLSGLTYFIFFGFGSAKEPYQPLITAILKPFGIKYPKERRRGVPKRTWMDILLRRPAQSTNSQGITVSRSTAVHFNPMRTKSSGATESYMDTQPANFLSFGEVPTLVGEGERKYMDNKNDAYNMPSSSTALKLNFDVEPQSPPPITTVEEGRREAPARDPELTEEITF